MVRDFKGTVSEKAYAENTPSPYSAHNPEWTTVAALEFIEENKDRPFYLHLCTRSRARWQSIRLFTRELSGAHDHALAKRDSRRAGV